MELSESAIKMLLAGIHGAKTSSATYWKRTIIINIIRLWVMRATISTDSERQCNSGVDIMGVTTTF